jgi:hypothetical protein
LSNIALYHSIHTTSFATSFPQSLVLAVPQILSLFDFNASLSHQCPPAADYIHDFFSFPHLFIFLFFERFSLMKQCYGLNGVQFEVLLAQEFSQCRLVLL